MDVSTRSKTLTRLGPVLLAYAAFIALGTPDGLLGIAWPTMRLDFGVPLDAVGMLLVASVIGYMTSSFLSGALVARLSPAGSGVLPQCQPGSLATAGFGTALGVIRAGVAAGRIDKVFAGETRPWNQGARLTVWELQQDGIDATLIAEEPKIAPYLHRMKVNIAEAVNLKVRFVGVKAPTNERLGALGRQEGIAALAVASVGPHDKGGQAQQAGNR